MDSSTNTTAVIQKMAVKVANVELRNAMLEVALEAAQAEIASLKAKAT